MKNSEKFLEFIEIAARFNRALGSVPIAYGSLGLAMAIDTELETNDIDILVEERVFVDQLNDLHQLMKALGYTLTDPEENEFERDGVKVGIAHDGDMIGFSGIDPNTLRVIDEPARHRVLSPSDYLDTYKASSLDGYRRDTRQKQDGHKIELITAYLLKQNS